MATQEMKNQDLVAKLASRLEQARGFSVRKKRHETDADAWRATVTQHAPEPWPAARLALQARIAALEVN
jgi:hypothetical protein